MPVRSATALALLLTVGGGAGGARAQSVAPAPFAADPAQAEADFESARALFDARLFEPAARAFARFRTAYPQSAHAADALYFEAEAALASGDAEGAARLFTAFQEASPGSPRASRARLALGEYYAATGDDDRAAEALREALDTPQPDADAARGYYLLGQVEQRRGNTDAAVASFERAGAYLDTPVAPQALYAAGAVRLETGDDAEAAAAFTQLAEAHPDSPENRAVGLGLAEALARLGRFEEAAAEIERRAPTLEGPERARADALWGDALLRLGRPSEASARLAAVPDSSAFHRAARLGLGRLAFDASDWDTAAEHFAAVRETPPAVPDASAEDDALSHEATYFEGIARKRSGQLGEAEQLLTAATARRPNGAYADAALLEVGLLRYERRQYREAAAAFDRVLTQYATSDLAGEAARMLGESYSAVGDVARAREAQRRAEALGVASAELGAEVAFQDAYALVAAGRHAEAVPRLLAVADEGGPRAGEALFQAGEAAFQAGDYARAEGLLTRFLQQYPAHRQADAARYVLAWTHFQRRNYTAAAMGFERFLSAYERRGDEPVPYYADALLRLADSYYALGRYDDARSVYARVPEATGGGSGSDYALFQTGQALAAAGRTEEAFATYDRVLAEYPTSSLRGEVAYARGVLLFEGERYDDAIAVYEEILAGGPSASLAARAQLGIADALFNAERPREAEAAYRRVLERHGDSPLAANAIEGLGYVLESEGRSGELEGIIASYEARSADPATRARLRLRQAELALGRGDFAVALDRADGLEPSFATDGNDPESAAAALHVEARALRELGRGEEAQAAFYRLLRQYPDTAAAAEARAATTPADGTEPADRPAEDASDDGNAPR